jgi:hypothetical protein
VAVVVQGVNGVAAGRQPGGDVGVAATVLAEAMGDDHDRDRVGGRQPGLPVVLLAAGSDESPGDVRRHRGLPVRDL